jgi:hypothetical protein
VKTRKTVQKRRSLCNRKKVRGQSEISRVDNGHVSVHPDYKNRVIVLMGSPPAESAKWLVSADLTVLVLLRAAWRVLCTHSVMRCTVCGLRTALRWSLRHSGSLVCGF